MNLGAGGWLCLHLYSLGAKPAPFVSIKRALDVLERD